MAIRAADVTHVDAAELLPQARQLALSVDRSAEMVLVSVTTSAGDGTVDVTKPSYALAYNFTGKNGSLQVSQWGSKLIANHVAGLTGRALGESVCSPRAAWKAALSRGAPKSGSAQLVLSDPGPPWGMIWTVIAGGTSIPVDGRTCAPKNGATR
jgi:hypothetical protein